MMKLIVGLGNPGNKHVNTRHNVGFVAVDELVDQFQHARSELVEGWKESKKGKLLHTWIARDVEVIKPQTFMNESGKSVLAVKKKHQKLEPENIFVLHDDLDIELGKYKIQKAKGPKDHGGLNSIYKSIGRNDFWHVRIGVDNRRKSQDTKLGNSKLDESLKKISGEKYVLQPFEKKEREIVDTIIKEVIEDLKTNYL